MECPKCGGLLNEIFAKVPLQMPYQSKEERKRKKHYTVKRKVYFCEPCNQAYVVTPRLVRTKIVD